MLINSVELRTLFPNVKILGINKGFAKPEDVSVKGKVIGEFVCDDWGFYPHRKSDRADYYFVDSDSLKEMCLSYEKLWEYGKNSKILYGWHISDLVIYDKPKELREFYTICPEWDKPDFTQKCLSCKHYYRCADDMACGCDIDGEIMLTRPPQSFCYVEEVKNDL